MCPDSACCECLGWKYLTLQSVRVNRNMPEEDGNSDRKYNKVVIYRRFLQHRNDCISYYRIFFSCRLWSFHGFLRFPSGFHHFTLNISDDEFTQRDMILIPHKVQMTCVHTHSHLTRWLLWIKSDWSGQMIFCVEGAYGNELTFCSCFIYIFSFSL